MLGIRVIPCLDIQAGRVVKGTNFVGIRDVGDPVELATRYDAEGADELTFLDIRASDQGRDILLDLVERVSRRLFIPFTVGGGLRTLEDVRAVLGAGADKVSIGTAAVKNPSLIRDIANTMGSQCLVVSLDVRRVGDHWELTSHGGRQATGIDAVQFAKQAAELGAGELLVNDMDADGTRAGFGHGLNRAISERVQIPVIASGGAGLPEHFVHAVAQGGVQAVLAAGIFHDGSVQIATVKQAMAAAGLPVRTTK